MYELRTEQTFPRPIEEVFAFFADAGNLARITPEWLEFQIQTPLPLEMRAGALIDYTIKLRGIPIEWRSEITHWAPPHLFIDTQVRGPYEVWTHEHRFTVVEARGGGGGGAGAGELAAAVMMTDTVRYQPPMAALTWKSFVGPEVERIFRFREQAMREIFGQIGEATLEHQEVR